MPLAGWGIWDSWEVPGLSEGCWVWRELGCRGVSGLCGVYVFWGQLGCAEGLWVIWGAAGKL